MDGFDGLLCLHLETNEPFTETNDEMKMIQTGELETFQRSSTQKNDLTIDDATFESESSPGQTEGNSRSYSSVEEWLESFSNSDLFFNQSYDSIVDDQMGLIEANGISKEENLDLNTCLEDILNNKPLHLESKNSVKLEESSFDDVMFNEWFDACANTSQVESLVPQNVSQVSLLSQSSSPFDQSLSSLDQNFSSTSAQQTSPQLFLNSPSTFFDSPFQPTCFNHVDSPPSTTSDSGVSWESVSLHRGKQMKEESDSKQAQKHEVISEALLTDSLEMKSRELERFITKNEQELYESLLNNISAYEDRSYQANLSNTTKTYSLSEVLLLNPSPQEGRLSLTNEEIIALKSEHQEISFQLPLNQRDLMCLKRVRRKIRNKLSAQESRRKRKEYTDNLELQVKKYKEENQSLQVRLHQMERTNRELMERHFSSVKLVSPGKKGLSLMVFVAFFAAFISSFDSIFPPPYTTPLDESFPKQSVLSIQMGPREPIWDHTPKDVKNILGPELEYPVVYPYYYRVTKSRLITDEENDRRQVSA